MFPNILTIIVVACIIYILGVKSSPYADYMGSPAAANDSTDTDEENEGDEEASGDDASEDEGASGDGAEEDDGEAS